MDSDMRNLVRSTELSPPASAQHRDETQACPGSVVTPRWDNGLLRGDLRRRHGLGWYRSDSVARRRDSTGPRLTVSQAAPQITLVNGVPVIQAIDPDLIIRQGLQRTRRDWMLTAIGLLKAQDPGWISTRRSGKSCRRCGAGRPGAPEAPFWALVTPPSPQPDASRSGCRATGRSWCWRPSSGSRTPAARCSPGHLGAPRPVPRRPARPQALP